jgi:precorrin-2 dehydrogenase/sirohydrochlorin ferrochelatase
VSTGPAVRPPQYPVNLDLAGVPVVVVGGGNVAARKVRGLLECGARVTVVAPEAVPELADHPQVRWQQRPYRRGEVASYRLAITATGQPDVDGQVYRDAQATGIPVNSADDPAHCSFTLPAIVRRGELQITVSTQGRSPAFASWLRREIEARLTNDLEAAFDLVTEVRDELRASGRSSEHPGWQRAFDDGLVRLVAEGRRDDARALLLRHLEADDLLTASGEARR